MILEGKIISGIEVYNANDDDRVIASICDGTLKTTNGYKIRVIPYVEEVKHEQ